MNNIAIVDDRIDNRQTLKRLIESFIEKDWYVIDLDPFPKLEDYYSFIIEEEISAIVLDERLHEQACGGNCKVDYNGHNLVEFLRKHFPEFPIFVVTSYPDDDELLEKFKDVEDIIERTKFSKQAEKFVPRITRSAQRFLEAYQRELTELSQIAEKIALGNSSDEDTDKAKAIRAKVGLAIPSESFVINAKTLDEIESKLKELSLVHEKIEKSLNERQKK
jgi:CheY-like chemotaxis protein